MTTLSPRGVEEDEPHHAPLSRMFSFPTFVSPAKLDEVRAAGGAPSIEKAERYRNLTLPRWRDDNHKYHEYGIWSFSADDMKQFGIGTMLVSDAQSFVCVLLICFLLPLPLLSTSSF